MQRRAVIIGANIDGKIPGVKHDLNSWYSFLTSLQGGAWNDDEIIILDNALNINDVLKAINTAARANYAFICFSGHGGIFELRKDAIGYNETIMYLSENEVISERQLNPGKNCGSLLKYLFRRPKLFQPAALNNFTV